MLIAAPLLALAFQCPDGSPPPCAARGTQASARSVAVLTFRLLSPDSSDAYLAEGLADAVTSRLSQVRRLDVASRTGARLGRQPHTAYIVSGTMLRQHQQLVVTVELLRAATGRDVWSGRYARADTSVLDTEQQIALAVATNILPTVDAVERTALGAEPTRNPEAYDHLLRGDFLLARRSLSSVTRAIHEYESAAALDPSLAKAQARIALACAIWIDWAWDPHGRPAPDSVLAKGLAAATRAVALDSMSSDAWMARAYMNMWLHPRTMEGVESGFRRALALDPRNAEAWHQLGDWLNSMKRAAEGDSALRTSLDIDPLQAGTLRNLGVNRGARGLALVDSSLRLDPSPPQTWGMRGLVRFQRGDTAGTRADILASLQRAGPEDSIEALGHGALGFLAIGDTATARTLVLAAAARLLPSGPVSLRTMALGGAMYLLGDPRAQALAARLQPRGAMLWFTFMNTGADLAAIQEPVRSVLLESKPPWVP